MQDEKKAFIVTGDVNIFARNQHNNRLTQFMYDENFKLLTKTATHIKDGRTQKHQSSTTKYYIKID